MLVPLILLVLAVLSSGVVAYGTHANWAQFPHGIEFIVWSRRLEWPLAAASLILCLALLVLVISGKRRAWWLIGLAPVLALFAHRFLTDPAAAMSIAENPPFVSADAANLADEDYVVGLKFGDHAYAYPYSALYFTPVVLQADHDKRMMLMWSALANRAVAQTITRDLRARDLEIVSVPANALLLYNTANGQFVNGLKGQTLRDQKPAGFGDPIVVSTMTWKDWRGINPETRVMSAPPAKRGSPPPPRGPLLPVNPMPPAILDVPANTPIVLVGNTRPAAFRSDEISAEPRIVTVDGQTAFVFRETPDKPVRAFACRLKGDLFPHFRLNANPKRKGAMFIDSDTDSGWSASGAWVDGMKEYRGTRLTPVPVQDGLYWGVMKFWYPALKLSAPTDPAEPQ